MSTAVKKNPNIDKLAEQILDTHVKIYENVVVLLVQENNGERESPKENEANDN